MEKTKESKAPKGRELKVASAVGLAVIVLWMGNGIALYCLPERGTFGDMFGAINALFSGLAFVGVVYAILLQHKELELQREDLVGNRKEINRTVVAQEEYAESMRLQAKSTYQAFQLQTLSVALRTVDKQIEDMRPFMKGDQDRQKFLRLEQEKKDIEYQISKLVDLVTLEH